MEFRQPATGMTCGRGRRGPGEARARAERARSPNSQGRDGEPVRSMPWLGSRYMSRTSRRPSSRASIGFGGMRPTFSVRNDLSSVRS